MELFEEISQTAQCVFLLVAAVSDAKNMKIPNRLILLGLGVGAVLALAGGWQHLLARLLSSGAALAIGFILWRLRAFKAGDAKLLWAAGIYTELPDLWQLLVFSILFGGFFSFLILLWKGLLFQRMKRVLSYLKNLLWTRTWSFYPLVDNDPCAFPFALSVFCGAVSVNILRCVGW